MASRPKCKLCGKPHWSYEGHDFGPVTSSVTHPRDKGQLVTSAVTQEIKEAMPLTDRHPCPLCGHWHERKYPSNAARQRAYRERQRGIDN
jgi:hypothetical protein